MKFAIITFLIAFFPSILFSGIDNYTAKIVSIQNHNSDITGDSYSEIQLEGLVANSSDKTHYESSNVSCKTRYDSNALLAFDSDEKGLLSISLTAYSIGKRVFVSFTDDTKINSRCTVRYIRLKDGI